MTKLNDIVVVRGVPYTVTGIRNLSYLGSKYFGKFRFTLHNAADGKDYAAIGKTVTHNSRVHTND